MVKLDHDDVAQNAEMGSVYDRLAEHFDRELYRSRPIGDEQRKVMRMVYETRTGKKFVPEVLPKRKPRPIPSFALNHYSERPEVLASDMLEESQN